METAAKLQAKPAYGEQSKATRPRMPLTPARSCSEPSLLSKGRALPPALAPPRIGGNPDAILEGLLAAAQNRVKRHELPAKKLGKSKSEAQLDVTRLPSQGENRQQMQEGNGPAKPWSLQEETETLARSLEQL